MTAKVKLNDILQALYFQGDDVSAFLDRKTNDVYLITDEDFDAADSGEGIEHYPEWQRDSIMTASTIMDSEEDEYIKLPTKFEINAYDIMESFCLTQNDPAIRNEFYVAIKGKGAFSRFKRAIQVCRKEEEWNHFREAAYKQVAIRWCEENGMMYED